MEDITAKHSSLAFEKINSLLSIGIADARIMCICSLSEFSYAWIALFLLFHFKISNTRHNLLGIFPSSERSRLFGPRSADNRRLGGANCSDRVPMVEELTARKSTVRVDRKEIQVEDVTN